MDTLDPIVDGFEGFFSSLIKANDDSISLSVELIGDVSELFLACSVPDFDLDSSIVFCIVVGGLNKIDGDRLQMTVLKVSLIDSSQ